MSEFYVYEEDDPIIEIDYNEKEIPKMNEEIKRNFIKEKHNSKIDNFTNLEKECLRLQQIQKLNSTIVDQATKK
jgi:hypothetical protein